MNADNMTQVCSFRQQDEKNVHSDVELMEWSPRMDLIALANVQGEVVLHRLSWQKVWTLAPRGENIAVRALAWRPDGKVLAVGYSSGLVLLSDVENSEILHTFELNVAVTIAQWISASEEYAANDPSSLCFQDNSSQFLPKLPSLSKSYGSLSKLTEENIEDSKKLGDQKCLNVLIVGTETGRLLLYIFGLFPAGDICPDETTSAAAILQSMSGQSSSDLHPPTRILAATISERLSSLSVVMETRQPDGGVQVNVLLFQTPLLETRYLELQVLALKYGKILSLMGYLNTTIRSISEAWENILLEIDSKLTKYAEEKFRSQSGTVSDDFLELLMFGTPTDELEKFLMHDLTEKGLKKLGHSIELSYSNIQKLVLKHLQSVGQAIVYHLSEVNGMALWRNKFGTLGLSSEAVGEALTAAGSFMMKATEIQQVIDNSMRNFKAFFRWLYVVILRLSDEPIPAEINKVNEQDLNFVAEFLMENFGEEWDPSKKSSFNLERVGQYLKAEDLPFPPDTSHNPWAQFLASNSAHFQTCPLLFPHHPNKSLVQQHLALQEAVTAALNRPSTIMSQSLQPTTTFTMLRGMKTVTRISQIYCSAGHRLFTVATADPLPCHSAILLEQFVDGSGIGRVRAARLTFDHLGSDVFYPFKNAKLLILDIQFYNEDMLSVLLVDSSGSESPVLSQVPLRHILDEMQAMMVDSLVESSVLERLTEKINAGACVESGHFRVLENMKPLSLAVSGSRKVACVLFASRRRVRLFEMDVDEEEETDEADETEEDRSHRLDWENSSLGLVDRSDVRGEDEDKENSRTHDVSP